MGLPYKLKLFFAKQLTDSVFFTLPFKLFKRRIYSFKAKRYFKINEQISAGIKASIFWGLYESSELRFVKKYLKENEIVVELGSSIGFISGYIKKRKKPKILICVEANPALTNLIRYNTYNFATVFNGILKSSKSFDEPYFLPGRNNIGGRVDFNTEGCGVKLESFNLETILNVFPEEEYVLICDIEGSEHDIIEEILSEGRCKLIIIETHKRMKGKDIQDIRTIEAFLQEYDYTILERYGPNVVAEKNK